MAFGEAHQGVSLLIRQVGRKSVLESLLQHRLVALPRSIVHAGGQLDGLQRRRERRGRRQT